MAHWRGRRDDVLGLVRMVREADDRRGPDGTRRGIGGIAVYIPETKLLHLPRDAAKKSAK